MSMEEYDKTGWTKPFERAHLNTKTDMVTCRMNFEERKALNELRGVFQCDRDSTILKQCLMYVHGNVVQSHPTRAFFEWLSNARRVRPGPKVK